MDAYEATRVVFSRIQAFDPDNAAKIITLLFAQDHGDKEMIRLAFGPETILQSLVLNARKDLGLHPPSSSSPPTSGGGAAPFLHRQNSIPSPRIPPPLSPSWGAFSRSNSMNGVADDHQAPPSPFFTGAHDLSDQVSYLPESASKTGGDPFFQDVADDLYWGSGDNPHRQDDVFMNIDGGVPGLWRPCHYYARGFCKNGSTCRFVHGAPEEGGKMDPALEQELLLRSRSPRLSGSAVSQLAFPYSPTSAMPGSPSSPSARSMNFLEHLQQNNAQRAAAAAAAAMILGGGCAEAHKLLGRARMERGDFTGISNPGSRQIYLTFPADSSFREEDVSNYFSIYGPVQDVRIPYQQKRMFGFVTFVYAETVKLILAKGNPHFVCDARVLVKPYKEKGKIPDKYRKLQLQQQADTLDFSGCISPTGGLDRDPYDPTQFGSRMMYNGSRAQEMLLRRKLEEQKQAAELQRAIELQSRRFMGLQLMELKTRNLPSPIGTPYNSNSVFSPPEHTSDHSSPEDKSPSSDDSSAASAAATALSLSQAADLLLSTSSSSSSNGLLHQDPATGSATVAAGDKDDSAGESSSLEDSSDFRESVVHNLADSPFASPKKASVTGGPFLFNSSNPAPELATGFAHANNSNTNSNLITSTTSSFNMPSFKPAFLQMPRFSAGHGAIGM